MLRDRVGTSGGDSQRSFPEVPPAEVLEPYWLVTAQPYCQYGLCHGAPGLGNRFKPPLLVSTVFCRYQGSFGLYPVHRHFHWASLPLPKALQTNGGVRPS